MNIRDSRQMDWYEMWMKQSKAFFDSAQDNLQDIFGKEKILNPEESVQQINQWMNKLKKQWQFEKLSEDQPNFENYIKLMSKMYNDAAEIMLAQWLKRIKENKPVKNIPELYDLWLNSCHAVYQQSLSSATDHETYAEFVDAAYKFWKSMIPG